MDERLLTAREAANLLGVYFRTLRRWAREGRVRSVRLPGNRVRFRPSDLTALMQDRVQVARVAERHLADSLTALEQQLHGEPKQPSRQSKPAGAQRARRTIRRRK